MQTWLYLLHPLWANLVKGFFLLDAILVSRQFIDNVAQICVLETESYEKIAYLSKFLDMNCSISQDEYPFPLPIQFSLYDYDYYYYFSRNSNEHPPLECWAHEFSIQDMECYPSLPFYETLSIEPISTIKVDAGFDCSEKVVSSSSLRKALIVKCVWICLCISLTNQR
ncbi:uncharacterized protein LOC107472378 isoform X2 [Arachis duranensis]|uniref:Uncharacterized protein LOC107472378 isoform X2 n=1 Tax=Arachis duranensis TaxID=130453 RepID=A0A9C6TE58_ARADU|nr:uncharacterized protein LOC107472378 isoform X2 [Arachis duranensis]